MRYIVELIDTDTSTQDDKNYLTYFNCEADHINHAIAQANVEYPFLEINAIFAQVY
jgi:hypothetical protein